MAHGTDILVPLDGSSLSENAIPAAAALQSIYGGLVRFVHVAEVQPPTSPDYDHARGIFVEYATSTGQRFGISSQSADLLVDRSPAQGILEATQGARFLVIASHGRGGFRATFVGSVADKVIRRTTIPALLIPGVGAATPFFTRRSIMVALDGSEASEIVLTAARDLARRAEAGLTLVRVASASIPAGLAFPEYPDVLTDPEAEAREYLLGTVRSGEQMLVLHGTTASAIVDAAHDRQPDVLVMGTQGKGLAARLALGSTTDRVMHSLHRPLLIVPAAQS